MLFLIVCRHLKNDVAFSEAEPEISGPEIPNGGASGREAPGK
jgi:hypothetical protein